MKRDFIPEQVSSLVKRKTHEHKTTKAERAQLWDRRHALKDYQLTTYFAFFCVTSMWVYYGFILGCFIVFTVPLEAVRLAPDWQAAFVIAERIIYGVVNFMATDCE